MTTFEFSNLPLGFFSQIAMIPRTPTRGEAMDGEPNLKKERFREGRAVIVPAETKIFLPYGYRRAELMLEYPPGTKLKYTKAPKATKH